MNVNMINSICVVVLAGLAGIFLLSKCLFLAPYRAGWLMLLANLVYEVAERKLRYERVWLDAILWPALVAGLWLVAGLPVAAIMAVVLGLAWGCSLNVDLKWKSGRQARQCQTLRGRVPLPIPQLIVNILGPVLERHRDGDELGDWPAGLEQSFEVLVLNPSLIPAQLPLTIRVVSANDGIAVLGTGCLEQPGPKPGEIVRLPFSLRSARCGTGGVVEVIVQLGDFEFRRALRIRSVVSRDKMTVRKARINRWKNGARGAFVWRGDQDLYDPATFQSAEGLRFTLGVARRFRMPSSLMLSARLSLVPEEHRAFCEHFEWDRKTGEIPEFIRFIRDEVEKAPEQEWPTTTDRLYAAEIGNHFYLHYGTHAAADAGNGWQSHARIGAGRYSWMSRYPADSVTEQRDNALRGSQVMKETIGVEPVSFTIPSDVFDPDTACAMEAAGLEVGSETDMPKLEKLVRLSPPHHPKGCERFVELPRMHPRDPENACQLAMLKYWVGVARRKGCAMVFLAHHHLMRYEGNGCANLTEELLRHVLSDQDGDLYVGTLTAVGRYWRDVLSDRTRCVRVTCEGPTVTVTNSGSRPLSGLPLEVSTQDGLTHMRIIAVPAQSSIVLEI